MFGLAFLSPLFLVGAAAAAIPIAIHLFYRRAEPVVDFAAMRYLRRAPVEQSRRRRLRELILLALRVSRSAWIIQSLITPGTSNTAPSVLLWLPRLASSKSRLRSVRMVLLTPCATTARSPQSASTRVRTSALAARPLSAI